MATYFYKAMFMDPLAHSQDSLNNSHANTHLPEIIGLQRGWELTGNKTLKSITEYFYKTLSTNYSGFVDIVGIVRVGIVGIQLGKNTTAPLAKSCTAGTIKNAACSGFTARTPTGCGGAHATGAVMEFYFKTGMTDESCSQYNALKVVRHMFQYSPTAALADDYERKLLNGVLGIQKPMHNGTMVYMSPLGKGVSRPQANWNQGWGTPDAAFWCCYGTAIESFAKLGDSIYFHSLGPSSSAATPTLSTPAASSASTLPSVSIPTLWIAQFISSDLAWDAAGMKVSQEAAYATINVRIPSWTVPAKTTLMLNGKSVLPAGPAGAGVKPGSFLSVTGAFKAGDVLEGSFETPTFALKANKAEVGKWLTVKPGLTFSAPGGWELLPLNSVVDQPYTAYFNGSQRSPPPPKAPKLAGVERRNSMIGQGQKKPHWQQCQDGAKRAAVQGVSI
eukprot:gene5022-20468_t